MIARPEERLQRRFILTPPELRCEWTNLGERCASPPSRRVSNRWLCGAHADLLLERRRTAKRSA
jgi:hypothetical protein